MKHIFSAHGILKDIDDIPFDTMWPDDKHWFPLFLEGKSFKGKFLFQDFDTIVEHNLEILNYL